MASRRKTTSKEVDLDEMVLSGPQGAYEALQLYRSRAIRLRSKNENEASITTLSQGAKCLLQNSYENAGAELAMLMIEFLSDIGQDITSGQVDRVMDVCNCLPAESPCAHRIEYLKAAIKWSIKTGSVEIGEGSFHVALGQCLWSTDQRTAIYHLAAGESPAQLNKLIQASYSSPDQHTAKVRAYTTGVLTFLSMEDLRHATELQGLYTSSQINLKDTFVKETRLETFCRYLLLTCQRDAQPLFKTLVNTYASELDFDETVPALLTGPIGLKFFGIKPKAQVNPMMNMLQQMLSK